MSNTGIIYGVNGPVIYLKGDSGFKISEMVYVGPEHLVGEIIGLKKGMTTVQVFEETTGLKPGDTVTGTGDAISVQVPDLWWFRLRTEWLRLVPEWCILRQEPHG